MYSELKLEHINLVKAISFLWKKLRLAADQTHIIFLFLLSTCAAKTPTVYHDSV